MMPTISIITVTMNHLPLLKGMLHSLFITCKPVVSFELIIVDNCSKDGTADFITQNYPSVILIENTNIHGFALNNNRGAQIAKGEYILILNPDIILREHSIDQLYNYLENHSDAGIVAPKLLNPDQSVQYSARKFISPKILLARFLTNGKDNSQNKYVQQYLMPNIENLTEATEVDWCMGAALLFKRDFYEALNGFDEKFFLYVEDMDICHRCWKMEKKVIYLPDSLMIHVHQRGSKYFNKKTIMHLKSQLYFFRKNRFKIERE